MPFGGAHVLVCMCVPARVCVCVFVRFTYSCGVSCVCVLVSHRGKFTEATVNPGLRYAEEVKSCIGKARADGKQVETFYCIHINACIHACTDIYLCIYHTSSSR